jgi:hypothetical protein
MEDPVYRGVVPIGRRQGRQASVGGILGEDDRPNLGGFS